jgi:transaldolase/glucose-6-phosphate isomerase
MANPLLEVQKFGQSIWYDNIRRGLITSGELQTMVERDGVLGVTSNPAIFTAAILGSTDYDQALKALVAQKQVGTAVEIYEKLAIEDIQLTADILYPVYLRTNRVDGYVSFEVSPYLANDTAGTITEARRLRAALGRDNVLIKVPATPAGIPAIQTLIGEGISINVTLLFSVEAYERVAEAYMTGLENYLAKGGDLSRVASVASFFISRIDSLVDDKIAGPGQLLDTTQDAARRDKLKSLVGKIAIANAKIAYARYKELYAGDRWQKLVETAPPGKKPMPQRLLWASTSTKNPKYPKTIYVDELIGPETVNTVPAETLNAYRELGRPRPSLTQDWAENLEQARQTMATLAEVGISMKEVTGTLLADAVKKFSDPFDKLLASVEKKRQALQRGMASQTYAIGEYASAVDKTLEDWRVNGKVRRLWAGDTSLWSGQDEKDWLGWLHIVDGQREHDEHFPQIVEDVKATGFTHALLLGMGGSSLAPEVWKKTFGKIPGFPELLVLDSTVPAQVRAFEKKVNLAKTLFIVSSKSGGTIEPNVFKQFFMDKVKQAVGADQAGARFVAITDPKTKMHDIAKKDRFRHIFFGEKSIGGRFSALSNFGMIPLAVMGVEVPQFLDHTELMVQACVSCVPPDLDPGVVLGVIMGTLAKQGRDKVTVITSPGISSLGAWLEQLMAESTGKAHPTTKQGVGLVPIDGERVGPPSVYGNDRLFVYERLTSAPSPEQDAAVKALGEAGYPVVRINLAEPIDMGQEMYRWEIATAVAGSILGINPFNQPDVEDAKVAARKLMAEFADKGRLPAETPVVQDAHLRLFTDPPNADAIITAAGGAKNPEAYLKAHLGRIKAGDYFAINAYVEMTDAHDQELQALRHAVRDAKKVATTLGYGPRFLHSTGQLHKGGTNSGVFLQITADDAEDVPIPGEKFSFSVLKQAQAQGDFKVLAERKRRILRVHLGADVKAGLIRLRELVQSVLSR